ncbi:helix-turn-helix domain-containing protein [Sporosarcina sp. G11-34]|uniref:helix-turn-helix domain-containing protein n=1 Tax=Sporosarcina sp. G11-34 TaxID=2849605 RepID=UPI0022A94B91|nr:helix-turn-helix transcriptional regulator [Sporosarcina sp. G11-34]MCZ2257319.1 helix-turn-helix domain-containing protein [Sporosarcina sp. G11-34]
MNKFGIQIRKLRKEKKLTLRSLAEQSHLSYSFIASLEKGRYNPSRESIYSLAKPLETDVNELLMLAGFLPEQSKTIEMQEYSHSSNHSTLHEQFALENIMEMSVTFQGNELKKVDKVALIAFLQTMSEMNSPK